MKLVPQEPLARYSVEGGFRPNRKRILEALLYVMGKKDSLSQYPIVKSIFLADRKHLNEVGRPITFDNYVAMQQGPVPSLIYNLLMLPNTFDEIYHSPRPWSVTRAGRYNRYRASRKPNLRVLSQTDQEALDEGFKTVSTLNTDQLEKLLHDDPGYKEAWGRRGSKASAVTAAVSLLDDRDEALIANLAYATRA
jgi:hypothetical protein